MKQCPPSHTIPHSQPWITVGDVSSVSEQIISASLYDPKHTSSLGLKLADHLRVPSAFITSSGRHALRYALLTLGITKGDEVIVPAYACQSISNEITRIGAIPVYTDVNQFGLIDCNLTKASLTIHTKAIIAVHIFGHLCDIPSLRQFNLPIIEDSCQFFPPRYNPLSLGINADISIFSFHPTKCLTAGHGGLVSLNNPSSSELFISNAYSTYSDELDATPFFNSMQAALLLSQLHRYDDFLNKRRQISILFNDELESLDIPLRTIPPKSQLFRYTILVDPSRSHKIISDFSHYQITLRRGVDSLPPQYIDNPSYPTSTSLQLLRSTLSIPFHPSLTNNQLDRILDCFKLLR